MFTAPNTRTMVSKRPSSLCTYPWFASPSNNPTFLVTAAAPSATAAPAPSETTDEQLVRQVQTDVQSALNGGQWLLSVYAPFKDKPALPGLADLSPDEARLFIYEAKANNTLEQAVRILIIFEFLYGLQSH